MYKPSTSSVVVKSGLSKLYRSSTGFALTGFVIVKTGLQAIKLTCQPSTIPQQALWWSKQASQRCSTNYVVDKTGLTITYRTSTSGVVKTGLLNFWSPLTGISGHQNWPADLLHALKCHNLYRPSTGFAVVRMYMMNIYKL